MKRARRFALPLALLIAVCQLSRGDDAADRQAWNDPPPQARLRVYWWWLNGNVTKESITRDLEANEGQGHLAAPCSWMPDGAEQDGNAQVPAWCRRFSAIAWRELFKHALREADRLGLEISLNIQSGWNLGGPVVKPEDAAEETRLYANANHRPGRQSHRSDRNPKDATIGTAICMSSPIP